MSHIWLRLFAIILTVSMQSPISSPSLRLSAPSLRGLRVSGSRKVAHPVRVPTEGRVCRHTFSQSPISSPSLRLSAPSLRGLRVSGSRKVARPVRVPTEGRVCRHTFSRGRARCQGPSPTVMKRGNFGLRNRLANVL